MSITITGVLDGLDMDPATRIVEIDIKRAGGGMVTVSGLTREEGHQLKEHFGDPVTLTIGAGTRQ